MCVYRVEAGWHDMHRFKVWICTSSFNAAVKKEPIELLISQLVQREIKITSYLANTLRDGTVNDLGAGWYYPLGAL